MVPELRSAFNTAFREDVYAQVIHNIEAGTGCAASLRFCESPLFLDQDLADELTRVAYDAADVVTSADYLQRSAAAVPDWLAPPINDTGPGFLIIDFALTKDPDGRVAPQLVEIQGFPSVCCLMLVMHQQLVRTYPFAWDNLSPYFGSFTEETYRSFLYRRIVAGCAPENVVTLEIHPEKQATHSDLAATERVLGIHTVCATKITAQRGRLFYPHGQTQVPIHRIFNRVTGDDLLDRRAEVEHVFAPDIEVEWVGHPSWFYRISKFSLPFIQRDYCPPTQFVSDLAELPADLDDYVLKPLYLHGGHGVEFGPSAERLRELSDPHHFILQRRIAYEPVVDTPAGPTNVEIRLILVCGGDRPVLLSNYVRMSRGLMMSMRYNIGNAWCGATLAYHPTSS